MSLKRKRLGLIVFGILAAIIVVEGMLRLASFSLWAHQEWQNRGLNPAGGDEYTILCLGESTTADKGVELTYPQQLEIILNRQNPGRRIRVINKGVPGTKTTRIVDEAATLLDTYQPDMVVVMMGVNDTFYPEVLSPLKGLGPWRNWKTARLFQWLWFSYANQHRWPDVLAEERAPGKPSLIRVDADSPAMALIEHGWTTLMKEFNRREMIPEAAQIGWLMLQVNPDNAYGYWSMYVWWEQQMGRQEAFALTKKLLWENGSGWLTVGNVAQLFFDNGQVDRWKELWGELLFRDREVMISSFRFGQNPLEREDLLKGIVFYHRLVSTEPRSWQAAGGLALCQLLSDNVRAETYFEKVWQHPYFFANNPLTVYNYRRLRDEVLGRSMKLVCVQYPLCSIAPLREMIENDPHIALVDNESVFKAAVRDEGYHAYFEDNFAGCFGHGSDAGYKLLAEQVAAAIQPLLPE